MADLRIVDAPELDESEVQGGLKIPTGGFGNKAINMNTVASWVVKDKDLSSKDYVDNAVAQSNQGLSGHVTNQNNPHGVTKSQVGLGNVNNTSDTDKPISNATSAALNLKADKTQLDAKADKSTTYNKTEIDGVVDDLYQSLEDNFVANGAALPYDPQVTYNDGAIVVDNGALKKVEGGTLVNAVDAESVSIGDSTLDVFFENQKRRNENILYASDFKITGDGSDESDKVQQMLNLATGKTLDFENKTVWCGKQVQLLNKRKFSLQNGLLKALASSRVDIENRVLFLNQCSDFTTVNFDADGNRQERTPDEKSIHTVTMRSCKNFIVINANWVNGVCDNLHFDCLTATVFDKSTHTRDGWFINCKFDNAFRNNLSCIVAQNIKFTNCEFTGANGTLPMAGVDIEANNYGGDGLSDNITFEKCLFARNVGWQFMPTQHDVPRNIVLDTCTVIAPDVSMYALLNKRLVAAGTSGATALPDVSNTGGIQVTSPDVEIRNTTFKDFPVGSGTAMRIGANAGAHARLLGCKFFDIKNTGFQTIQAHNSSDGIFIDQKCVFKNTTGISLGGKYSVFRNAELDNCALIGSGSTAGKVIVERIKATNGTANRFIYLESENAEIIDCELTGLNHTSPIAYIQAEKKGAVVRGNRCISTEQKDVAGIRYDATTVRELTSNDCVNLSLTKDYEVLNPLGLSGVVRDNKGNVKNIDTLTPVRAMPTSQRPAANTVPLYSSIYDTTLKQIIVSDGADWVAPKTTTLTYDPPSIAAKATEVTTVTLQGVAIGQPAIAAFSRYNAGIKINAVVSAANTVTVGFENTTDAAIDLLSGTLTVKAI